MLKTLDHRGETEDARGASATSPDRLRLYAERARGEAVLSVGPSGVKRLREGGSLKIRLPSGSSQAILINTAGGMAGGDDYAVDLAVEKGGRLSVTSQAAERVYRSLGPAAAFRVRHRVAAKAALFWLPQETILFDGSSLHRAVDVDLAEDADFLGLESTVLGRGESGEVIRSMQFGEDWTIRREGRLVHAERLRIEGSPPRSLACLGGAHAFATLVFASPRAEEHLSRVLPLLNAASGASAWKGKLVLRLLAEDGFRMRKLLLAILPVLVPSAELPGLWLS